MTAILTFVVLLWAGSASQLFRGEVMDQGTHRPSYPRPSVGLSTRLDACA